MGPALRQLTILLSKIKSKTQKGRERHEAITMVTPIKTFYGASFAPDRIFNSVIYINSVNSHNHFMR